jgi:hypothetical protein
MWRNMVWEMSPLLIAHLLFKGIKTGVRGNMVWEVLIACLLSNGIKDVTVKEEVKQYNQV